MGGGGGAQEERPARSSIPQAPGDRTRVHGDRFTARGLQGGAPLSDSNFQVYDLMKGTIRSETIRISASLSW